MLTVGQHKVEKAVEAISIIRSGAAVSSVGFFISIALKSCNKNSFHKAQVMSLAKIVILVFIVLEFSNVLALYFAPGSKYANAVGVFTAWEKSKQHPEIHDFIRYLVYWVAGAKLIFLMLLAVVVMFADLDSQRMSLLALAIATASFYWRLFPLIRNMDKAGQINPKNYSILLGLTILVFIAVFVTAIIL